MPNWKAELKVKRGDYGYAIGFRMLAEKIDGEGAITMEPADLSGAEEINLICKVGQSPAVILGPLDPAYDDGEDQADWPNGIAWYMVEQPDFETVMKLDAEIEVKPAEGGVITWPNDGFTTIDVRPDLGDKTS